MSDDAPVVALHQALGRANTNSQLRRVLHEATAIGHRINECGTCRDVRDRVENAALAMHERVERDLSWHPPADKLVVDDLERIRNAAKSFAHVIVDATPPGREQSRALSAVEDALQLAIAGRVRRQAGGGVETSAPPGSL